MIQPTDIEIEFIKKIISDSLKQLIEFDSDIFNMDLEIEMAQEVSENAKRLNRKLHETYISHRLAHYLENVLEDTDYEDYCVDIEYNRFYGNLKILNTVEGQLSVRPDIIIHSRVDDTFDPQHLLVIEAKKEAISNHDISKIKGFISDDNYNYVFGLTVSYCSDETQIIAKLYYFNGTEIVNENINEDK
jgi:hypothetical protein